MPRLSPNSLGLSTVAWCVNMSTVFMFLAFMYASTYPAAAMRSVSD